MAAAPVSAPPRRQVRDEFPIFRHAIGAADAALHPNISGALAAVAESPDYSRRPKVVVTSLDFPTIAYQWLAKAGEGVGRTALAATSHVFFASGAVQDVAGLAGRVRVSPYFHDDADDHLVLVELLKP